MEKLKTTIFIPQELEDFGERLYHIEYPPGVNAGDPVTLCGWTDVDNEYCDASEHRPTCLSCIAILRYCKNLKTGRLKG